MVAEANDGVHVAPVLRGLVAVVFVLVVALGDPGGSDGVIACAGIYGLVETGFAAAILRERFPGLARVATVALGVLVIGVGILPLLVPTAAAGIDVWTVSIWLCVVGLAVISRSMDLRRRAAAGASVASAGLALAAALYVPEQQLHLVAVAAFLSAAALWNISPSTIRTTS